MLNFTNQIFDWLWLPLKHTPCYLDIVFLSAISALLFMVLFKKTSNQKKVKSIKNKILANILQIRFYKDDPLLILRSILCVLRYNLIYLRYVLAPLLVIIVPVLLITMQINDRYGYAPLEKNKAFIVRLDLARDQLKDPIALQLDRIHIRPSASIMIDAPPLHDKHQGSVFWRARLVSGTNDSRPHLELGFGNEIVGKRILAGKTKERFSPVKAKWTAPYGLMQNAEGFLSSSGPIRAVYVSTERASYPFLWWRVDPVVFYFILTLIFGLFFKPLLKVQI